MSVNLKHHPLYPYLKVWHLNQFNSSKQDKAITELADMCAQHIIRLYESKKTRTPLASNAILFSDTFFDFEVLKKIEKAVLKQRNQ